MGYFNKCNTTRNKVALIVIDTVRRAVLKMGFLVEFLINPK